MPDPRHILENRQLGVFGRRLHDPSLWYLNRRSASGAFAVGLFMMYMPPFGQMAMAAAAAILLRVNLPISVVLVWITNPITIPPMFYFAYVIGCAILGTPAAHMDMDFWADPDHWIEVLKPLSLGMLVCASACSAAGYLAIRGLWRWSLVREIRRRQARYLAMVGEASLPTETLGSERPAPIPAPLVEPSSSRQT